MKEAPRPRAERIPYLEQQSLMTNLLRKVRHRVHSYRARGAQRLAEIASRQEVLCPAEIAETPPAIYDEAALSRVTECEKTTNFEHEMSRLRGGERHHGATVLYQLNGVELRDGWLFESGRPVQRLTLRDTPGERTIGRIERAAYAGTFVGSFYFGHWLSDDLPLLLEAGQHAPPVIAAHTPYLQERGYLQLARLEARSVAHAQFDTLLWIDNEAQNSRRAAQYRELRGRIARDTRPVGGRRIMLHRGRSGASRVLINELELEELVASRGYEIVDPSHLSAIQIAQACAGARIALCVEGSQLTHAFLAMAAKSAIVALIPPYRYINHYKDLTDCLGTMRYGSLVGTPAQGGFHVDPEELLRLLDRVEAALDQDSSAPGV